MKLIKKLMIVLAMPFILIGVILWGFWQVVDDLYQRLFENKEL